MEAIDKLRVIMNWLNSHDEHFNQLVKNFSDFEKIYDYCEKNEIDYCDLQSFFAYYEQKEYLKHMKAINKLVGYELYRVTKTK